MNGEKRTILHIVEGSFLWRSPNYDDLQNISSGPESRATILGMILQCLMMQGVPGIIASLALTEPLALIFVISKNACLMYLIVRKLLIKLWQSRCLGKSGQMRCLTWKVSQE